MYENAVNNGIFNAQKSHTARVKDVSGGRVQLEISVDRLDSITVPAISTGTRIDVAKVRKIVDTQMGKTGQQHGEFFPRGDYGWADEGR